MAIPGIKKAVGRKRRNRYDLTDELLIYLPLDDEFIASGYEPGAVSGLSRIYNDPVKYVSNPLISSPTDTLLSYCATPIYSEDLSVYQMWVMQYQNVREDDPTYVVVLYESTDGLSWSAPTLNQFVYDGSTANNVCLSIDAEDGIHIGNVFEVPTSHEVPLWMRTYRLLMLVGHENSTWVYGSVDGRTWEKTERFSINHAADTQAYLVPGFSSTSEWYLYTRPVHLGPTDKRVTGLLTAEALFGLSESAPEATIIVSPDAMDATIYVGHFYGQPVMRYGGVYIGWIWLFVDMTSEPNPLHQQICGQLSWSYDGVNWIRIPGRQIGFPTATAEGGAWDDGMVFPVWPALVMSNEWWIYYTGSDGDHNDDTRDHAVGLAKMRKEGLASVVGDATGPIMRTTQFVWQGGELRVNANASGGQVRTRVLDSGGSVISGYAFSDMTSISSDDTDHSITCSATMDALDGDTISLEFEIASASLYAWSANP